MKKLLGGIFQRHAAPPASPPKDEGSVRVSPTAGVSSGAAAGAKGKDHNWIYRTGPRGSWASFFGGNAAVRASASASVVAPVSAVPTPPKVFRQNLDMLLKEIASRMKAMIPKMLEGQEITNEMDDLLSFAVLAGDKLDEQAEHSPLDALKVYFASHEGRALCERAAFPSLLLDFVGKTRVHMLELELKRLQIVSDGSEHSSRADSMERGLEFLMVCVVAVASSTELIEKYRCELPNLVQLAAEEYPSSALFMRDLACQALASVPDKNFSAALVWYLHDCNIIAKTVRLMTNYANATPITRVNADKALRLLTGESDAADQRENSSDRSKGDQAVIEAVSDALGLNKSADTNVLTRGDETASSTTDPAGASVEKVETYCLPSYSPLTGLKVLIYVLHKTCRYSLVLLGEFQSSGGYSLLGEQLKNCEESDISTYLYLFTLLLPLGTGFSGVCGDDESMATVSTCGARNASAFMTMRDVLLSSIIALDKQKKDCAQVEGSSLCGEQLVLQLLTTILHVYTSDYDNFVSLEPKTQMLALVLTQLPWIPFEDGQIIVLRIVEYVCGAAKPETVLPMDILSVLCNLFIEHTTLETQDLIIPQQDRAESDQTQVLDSTKENDVCSGSTPASDPKHSSHLPSSTISAMLCNCITKIVRDSPVDAFKAELRRFGLLERGVYAYLSKIANVLLTIQPSQATLYLSHLEIHLSLWCALLSSMLHDDLQACVEFRQLNMHLSLYVLIEALIPNEDAKSQACCGIVKRSPVLEPFIELAGFKVTEYNPDASTEMEEDVRILRAGVESDFSKLLGLLQGFRGCTEKQLPLLEVITLMLGNGEFVWTAWRESQGYEILISMLSSLNLAGCAIDDTKCQVLDSILGIFSTTLDPQSAISANLLYFQHQIGYSALASCLSNSGVLTTPLLPFVLNRIFELITGNTSPRNKIRNGDAVQVIFQLLPSLPVEDAISTLNRLLLKLLSNDEVGFSKKKQVSLLVNAGVFKWIADASIMSMLLDNEHPLKDPIISFLVELAKEELAISHLREFMRIIGKGMPLLLSNGYVSNAVEGIDPPLKVTPPPEIGLQLFERVLNSSTVPQTKVGTHVKTRMASGYVHVVNSTDRIWPPSSGYSFSCWLRFPPSGKSHPTEEPDSAAVISNMDTASDLPATASASSEGGTVCVALCEGSLSVRLDGDDTEHENAFGVLVGASLMLFSSSESASRSEKPLLSLDVTAVARNGVSEFYFWSHEKRYIARYNSIEDTEMWWRAMQQSESISNVTTRQNISGGLNKDTEVLFVSPEQTADTSTEPALDGAACILSVYSMESSGCFVRIFFERGTGLLRVDTGSVSAGPNMNPNPKRTSAVFKSVDIELLRARQGSYNSHSRSKLTPASELTEKPSQWHHFAFTHRKSVVGSSLLTLFVDGLEVATKKLTYPSAPSVGTMQAFIGKDIQICGTYPALPWSIGPAWLVEDILPSSSIACMFLLGPSFGGRFSGYAYRSIGDWPEALAVSQLDRTTRRHVEIVRAAKRLQLTKLVRASQRTWNELVFETGPGTDTVEAVPTKDEPSSDNSRITNPSNTSRKENLKLEGFQSFVKHDCAMSALGIEILQVLSSFKLLDEEVLFSLNTKYHAQTKSQIIAHTQIQFVGTEASYPLDLAKLLPSVGGLSQLLFPLLENSWRATELNIVLRLLARVVRRNPSCMAECLEINGYALVTSLLCARSKLIDAVVLKAVVRLAVTGKFSSDLTKSSTNVETSNQSGTTTPTGSVPTIVDYAALTQILLCTEFRNQLNQALQCQLLGYLVDLVLPSNPNALFNARQLRRADIMSWMLVYLAELSSMECTLDTPAALQIRWCYPQFSDQRFDDVLQNLLLLIRSYLRVESHPDDISSITEMLLLSLSPDAAHFNEGCIRVVMLQFLLHEIEQDATERQQSKVLPIDSIAETIVNGVFAQPSIGGAKSKRKEKPPESGGVSNPLSVLSPTGDSNTTGFFASSGAVDGFDNTLLEIISRSESSPYAEVEILLAVRILLSLAQDYPVFARQLFLPRSVQKFKRVLRQYSTNCNVYTPLIAYVSNISIRDTKYYDLVWSPGTGTFQQFALPTPCGFTNSDKACLSQAWEILGSLMIHNVWVENEEARAINSIVLDQLSFQVEISESFFTSVCQSSSVVLRILVQMLVPSGKHTGIEGSQDIKEAGNVNSARVHSNERLPISSMPLQRAFMALVSGHPTVSKLTARGALPAACLNLLRILLNRLLFEKEECAAFMMFLLECLNDAAEQSGDLFALSDGQKCWLALLVHVVKTTKALADNCTLTSLKNICSLAIAMARYLIDDDKHDRAPSDHSLEPLTRSFDGSQGKNEGVSPSSSASFHRPGIAREESVNGPISGATGSASCFGTDVLLFFLSTVRMCAEPLIAQLLGVDDQQFFYGAFVYCAQSVALSELNGPHKGVTPSERLLSCLTTSKQLLFQHTKCSGVIVCGTSTSHHNVPSTGGASTIGNDSSGSGFGQGPPVSTTTGGITAQLNRMRNPLVSSSHKEFGVGSESDRSFILSLAAVLFVMLIDDSESVRYASIKLWQHVMQQRMGVLKELLIVEPRVSLLQNMTASKKEVIDVFHGGFERLLQITVPQHRSSLESGDVSTEPTTAEVELSRESWLQFHLWLTEHFDLLKELILVRTEPIYQHLVDVLTTCLCIRKVVTSSSGNGGGGALSGSAITARNKDLTLNLDFALYFDRELCSKSIQYCPAMDDIDVGYKLVSRRAILKYTNIAQMALASMNDGFTRWQEFRQRLLHTRSIWQFSGWSQVKDTVFVRLSDNDNEEAEARVSDDSGVEMSTLICTERSIFQQNAFRYRLDFTEGPQRMRIRLMRNYAALAKPGILIHDVANDFETTKMDAQDSSAAESNATREVKYGDAPSASIGKLYARAAEFHEAVDVYREFLFKYHASKHSSTTSSNSAPEVSVLSAIFMKILQRCKLDAMRSVFKDLTEASTSPSAVAAAVFDFFLVPTQSTDIDTHDACYGLGISNSLIETIHQTILRSDGNADALPPTLFDAADAEAMQSAICASRAIPSTVGEEDQPVTSPTFSDDEDNGIDDGQAEQTEDYHVGDDPEEDDRMVEGGPVESSEKSIDTTETAKIETMEGKTPAVSGEQPARGDANQTVGVKVDEAVFDSSLDYVFGCIARFLSSDDYPPLRCYNVGYIAGMTKYDGVFVLGRSSFYFIGGYGKLYTGQSESGIPSGDSATAAGVFPLFTASGPVGSSVKSPTGKAAKKKKTKDRIKMTLADWGTSFVSPIKSADTEPFTIAPLPSSVQHSDTLLNSSAGLRLATPNIPSTTKNWSIKYSNVKQFCRMKYQLRPVGIEFFDTFGSTFFVQFESHEQREEVLKLVFQMPIVNSIFWSPLLRSSAISLSAKRIRQALTKRWLRGTISNFEYLIHLNTLAGRTFNDLTQYPVFPWVVADYTSDVLDLSDPKSFRDLSKPMGALHENRAAQFRERYNAMCHDVINSDDNHYMMAAFHYGTHYSCSAYVVNYLIRLEPFSKLARELQGGEFDHADRLFRSIPASWDSASRENLQDVRELIPEFYFLPEFLYNANAYELGTTQSGEVVDHVKLPTWAHGDAREFVRVHRQALESKFVSEHLHEWIDLVFGVKQTGQAALAALNVFMPITYEGTVDIDSITDPVMRAATLAQIENFGQTPSRIFTSPHPARKVPTLSGSTIAPAPGTGLGISPGMSSSPVQASPESPDSNSAASTATTSTVNSLSSVEAFVKWHIPLAPPLVSVGKDYVFLKKVMAAKVIDGPVGDMVLINDKFHCRGQGCRFIPPRFSKYVDWGAPNASAGVVGDGTIKLRVHQTSARYREANKVIGVIEGAHFYRVNCTAISDDGTVIVTGGEDATVNILESSKANGGVGGATQRIFKQLAKLVGHEDQVVSVAINKDFNVVVSGSADCGAIVWDLRTRAFLRELSGHAHPVDKVAINGASGNILTASVVELRAWSINGDLLAAVSSVQALGLSAITSLVSTRCESWQPGVVAVTGHSNGTIALWGLMYPSDIVQDQKAARDPVRVGRADVSSSPQMSSPASRRPSSRSTGYKAATLKVLPSCQLFVMKLLMDHRVSVTALSVGLDQRQLLSGDADGNCIRWVDDSVSVNIL